MVGLRSAPRSAILWEISFLEIYGRVNGTLDDGRTCMKEAESWIYKEEEVRRDV
jgi:hypothetical protein